MKHLYFMRHGETLFNVRRRIQGWCDSPLTEDGIAMAKKAGTLIKDVSFDHFYCSTAERCCDTMEIVAGADVPYTRLKGLKERGFGIFEGESEDLNPSWDDPSFTYDDLFPHYGGETSEEVRNRLRSTIDAIMEQEDHQTVLVVSHAGAGMNFISSIMDNPRSILPKGFPNCGILHFGYENGEYSFIELLKP